MSCPDDGLLCAVGDICDSVHHICITPEQAAVCSGQADMTPCSAGPLNGACNMGVCLPTGCGNHVVDQGELCDDGNRISGDGCNAICTSTEVCGNGIIDTTLGETCDDGNLTSRDGCDSRCGMEEETWALEGIAPTLGMPGWAAYDPVHQRIVLVGRTGTWELNGLAWKLVTLETPPASLWHQVVWVPSISRIVYVTGSGTVPLSTWTWDGATWTQLTTSNAPKTAVPSATFYPPTSSLMVVGATGAGTQLWSLDPTTGAWTQVTSMPTLYFSYGGGMAYDATRNSLIILAAGNGGSVAPTTLEWDGTTWTSTGTTLGANAPIRDWAVVYDPVNAGVVAVGGLLNSDGTSMLYKYTGTSTWASAGTMPAPRYVAAVAFDSDTQRLVVVNGQTAAGIGDGILIRSGTTWTGPSRQASPYAINFGATYDNGHGRLVRYGGTFAANQTWTYDGSWHDLTNASMPAQGNGTIAYDPVRNASVVTGLGAGTWVLEGDAWRKLVTSDTGHAMSAMAYSPGQRAIIGVDGAGTAWSLPSETDEWTALPSGPIPILQMTLAYDARANQIVAAEDGDGRVYELGPSGWTPTLSPGASHRAVANSRRGTVEFIAIDGSASWERIDGVWFARAPAPYSLTNASVVESATASELLLVGNVDDARVILRRQYKSSLPLESCVAGEDADGDSLAGCADADCWSSCTPACPPFASCP